MQFLGKGGGGEGCGGREGCGGSAGWGKVPCSFPSSIILHSAIQAPIFLLIYIFYHFLSSLCPLSCLSECLMTEKHRSVQLASLTTNSSSHFRLLSCCH